MTLALVGIVALLLGFFLRPMWDEWRASSTTPTVAGAVAELPRSIATWLTPSLPKGGL